MRGCEREKSWVLHTNFSELWRTLCLLAQTSEATRTVNMCKAWVTRAAAAAQRSLGTYKIPPECLMHRREGP